MSSLWGFSLKKLIDFLGFKCIYSGDFIYFSNCRFKFIIKKKKKKKNATKFVPSKIF